MNIALARSVGGANVCVEKVIWRMSILALLQCRPYYIFLPRTLWYTIIILWCVNSYSERIACSSSRSGGFNWANMDNRRSWVSKKRKRINNDSIHNNSRSGVSCDVHAVHRLRFLTSTKYNCNYIYISNAYPLIDYLYIHYALLCVHLFLIYVYVWS